MIKKYLLVLSFCFFGMASFAQDENGLDSPVNDIFASPMNIDNQTTVKGFKGSKLMFIQHRFTDKIEKYDNLFGLYGSSNIRMAFSYGITDKFTFTFGTEKARMLQEFAGKYIIFEQSGKMPVSLAAYANMTIDGRSTSLFGNDYKFIDRMSYFAQAIVSRKFSDRISFEAGGSFIHFNKVELSSDGKNPAYSHNSIGVMAGGRAKVYNEIALIAEYSQVFRMETFTAQVAPKPDIAFGIEFGTGTHAFQIFASTCSSLSPQYNYVFNQKELKDLMLGFNITVRM